MSKDEEGDTYIRAISSLYRREIGEGLRFRLFEEIASLNAAPC